MTVDVTLGHCMDSNIQSFHAFVERRCISLISSKENSDEMSPSAVKAAEQCILVLVIAADARTWSTWDVRICSQFAAGKPLRWMVAGYKIQDNEMDVGFVLMEICLLTFMKALFLTISKCML